MATIELSVTTINRGHSIYKIQNSSFPIATEGTDLQLAGTRSSGQGCEVNSESFGQNDLHRGREGNTGLEPLSLVKGATKISVRLRQPCHHMEYAAFRLTGFDGPGFEFHTAASPEGRWRIFRWRSSHARPRRQTGPIEWLLPAAFRRSPSPWRRNGLATLGYSVLGRGGLFLGCAFLFADAA